jgi:hypothetical protein
MPLVNFNPVSLSEGYKVDIDKFNTETNSNLVYHASFNKILKPDINVKDVV